MDLRVVKTKRAIKDAFLQLRNNFPLEKVRVKDICEIAVINKTTFYKYYQDIYALEAEMENEAIDLVIESFETKADIFSDPFRFITGLPNALDANRELLQPLFQENLDKLFILLERRLKSCYSTSDYTDVEDILLTFVIGGTLHTLRTMKCERNCDDIILAKGVSEIISKIQ